MKARVHRRRWIGVFGAPILIAASTLAGLLAALLLGDFGRYVSWIAVAVPVVICGWVWCGGLAGD